MRLVVQDITFYPSRFLIPPTTCSATNTGNLSNLTIRIKALQQAVPMRAAGVVDNTVTEHDNAEFTFILIEDSRGTR